MGRCSGVWMLTLTLALVTGSVVTADLSCMNATSPTFHYSPTFADLAVQAPAVFYGSLVCGDGVKACDATNTNFWIQCVLKQPQGETPTLISIGRDPEDTCAAVTNFTAADYEVGVMFVVLVQQDADGSWRWFQGYQGMRPAIRYDDVILDTLSDSCGLDATWRDPVPESRESTCPRQYQSTQATCSHARAGCPPYWYRSGDLCYGVGKEAMNREDSMELCAMHDGTLATFPDDVTRGDILARLMGPENWWWTGGAKVATDEGDTYQWNGDDVFKGGMAMTNFDQSGEYLVLSANGTWTSVGAKHTAYPLCSTEPSFLEALEENSNLLISFVSDDYDLTFCCKHSTQAGEVLNITTNGGTYESARVRFDHKPKFFLRDVKDTLSNYTILLLDVSGKDRTRGTKLEPYALWMVVDVPRDSRPSADGQLYPDYGNTLIPSNGKAPANMVSLDKEGHEYVFLVFQQSRQIGRFNASLLSPSKSPIGSFLRPAVLQDSINLKQIANRQLNVVIDVYSIWYQVTQRGGHSTKWCPYYWPDLADNVEAGQVVCGKLPPASSAVTQAKLMTSLVFAVWALVLVVCV